MTDNPTAETGPLAGVAAIEAELNALLGRLTYADCLVCGLPDPERSGVVSCANCLRARSTIADLRGVAAAIAATLGTTTTAETRLRSGLAPDVERGVQCYHGTPRACRSIRCGSNCTDRFDRMHSLGGDPYALTAGAES